MKDQELIETNGKSERKAWKIIKGECQAVPVYRYKTGGRTIYQVPIPGAKAPEKTRHTTTNKKTAVDMATTLAGVPARMAPTLAGITPELLVKTGEAIQKLEPVLLPLGIPLHAGLEEYAALKARAGKLALDEVLDGLLTLGGASGELLPVRLREVADAIAKLVPIVEPLKISVASAIEEYAAVKVKVGAQDLRELFSQQLSKTWIEGSKTPIARVVEEFLKSRKDESSVSGEYYKTLYYTLGKVVELLGNVPIGRVTTEQLKPIVFRQDIVPRSRKTYRTNLNTFFNWARLNQYLDYSQPTAAERLAKIKLPDPTPRILEVSEAKAILTALEDPWCILYAVMSLFTAIRHDELHELPFDCIKAGSLVDIPAEISKTGKRRIIPIQPALNAWLAPFYDRAGLVLPVSDRQLKLRQFIQEADVPGLPAKWSRNWLRQSYASYRLAQTGKLIQTSDEDGHDAYVLERVYLHRSTEADALAFFDLTPEACGKPDWNDRIKAFLQGVPEVHIRRKNKCKPWKKIGGNQVEDPIPLQKSVPSQKAA